MSHNQPLKTLALALLLVAGCGGENLLAPPDGPACTQGGIAPGDSVTGHLGAASCLAWTIDNGSNTYLASWTLQAKRNRAYVVRLHHIPDGDGDDNLNGDLYAYGRNAAGDPVFLTGAWNEFGTGNPNNGYGQEMYLVPTTDQTLSLRIESSLADTGSYSLVVESCQAIPLTIGETKTGINMTAGCLAKGFNGDALPEQLVFGSFAGDTANGTAVTVLRTSGTSLLRGRVTGPDLDVSCWSSGCLWQSLGPANDTLTAAVLPQRPGSLTLIVAADTAGTTTVDLTAAIAPIPTPVALIRDGRNPSRPRRTTP